MSDPRPVEPIVVAQIVESYVGDQIRTAAKYSNRELFDESCVYDLHSIAAKVYALGFEEGRSVEGWRLNEDRLRVRMPHEPLRRPSHE